MNQLEAVVAAAGPELREHAVSPLPAGRWTGPGEREFVLEAVYEGHLLHHGTPRAFAAIDDDLRLLAGDELYALGLSRLALSGDLEAVAELADLISLCAWARSEGRPKALIDQLWNASERLLFEGSGGGARAALARLAPDGDR